MEMEQKNLEGIRPKHGSAGWIWLLTFLILALVGWLVYAGITVSQRGSAGSTAVNGSCSTAYGSQCELQ